MCHGGVVLRRVSLSLGRGTHARTCAAAHQPLLLACPPCPSQRVPLRHRVCQLAHALRDHGGRLPEGQPGLVGAHCLTGPGLRKLCRACSVCRRAAVEWMHSCKSTWAGERRLCPWTVRCKAGTRQADASNDFPHSLTRENIQKNSRTNAADMKHHAGSRRQPTGPSSRQRQVSAD